MGFAVVAAGAVSKTDFVNEPCIFQVAQRVVNGCVADAGQSPACSLKDVARGGVVVSFLNDLKNRLPLGRQLWLRLLFLLCDFHDGFRLILNLDIVKPQVNADNADQSLSAANYWVFLNEVDDFIDVAFERRALDFVGGE